MTTDGAYVVRLPSDGDFAALYALGAATPEIRTSASFAFMDEAEFRGAMSDPGAVFLVASPAAEASAPFMTRENVRAFMTPANVEPPVAFIYAKRGDSERPAKNWACLVYLVVDPGHRRQGLATRLYEACLDLLRMEGVTHMYGWADAEGDGAIRSFMQGLGYAEGKKYVWVDRRIADAPPEAAP